MVDPQIITEWLQKADEDFDFACSVIDDSPFYAQICFHFHDDCRFLNGFYIEARYPVHWPTQYTKELALKARAAAEHVHDEINKFIIHP